MDKGTGSCGRALVPDVLAEILSRLPPNTRRRLRLVCRHWRHTVDTCTATDLRPRRAKTIVAIAETAFVYEDLSAAGRPRELWTRAMADGFKGMTMLGTCNGLICMCDDREPGGAITLANPVTGETLPIPPLPPSSYAGGNRKWHRTYSFTYHPATGRYKIVHVPQNLDQIMVFTLGEASWREVPTVYRGARCNLDTGIVSADGYMYLKVEGPDARVVSFDLDHESFTSVGPLPAILSRQGSWGLTEVHGRLGIAFTHDAAEDLVRTDVWVMEGVPGNPKWSCWYILQVRRLPHQAASSLWIHQRHCLAGPHFAHSGKHILTLGASNFVFSHVPSGNTKKARHGVVDINARNQGRVIIIDAAQNNHSATTKTFYYIETVEQLSVYKCW
jgi:F-box interacting protein